MSSQYSTFFYLLSTFLLCLGLNGCTGTKFLKDGEQLLRKQTIYNAPNKSFSAQLSQLYIQKPNSKIPIIGASPSIWLYQWGLKRMDSNKFHVKIKKIKDRYEKKIKHKSQKKVTRLEEKKKKKIDRQLKKIGEENWLMKSGEPLATYHPKSTQSTIKKMQEFLVTEGYFHNKVTVVEEDKRKKMQLKYMVEAGDPHIIENYEIVSNDSLLQDLIVHRKPSFFSKSAERYSQQSLTNTREAIEGFLQNNGYYGFDKTTALYYKVDTLHTEKNKMKVTFVIDNENKQFKPFFIDTVRMIIHHPFLKIKPINSTYKQLIFSFAKDNYPVKNLAYNIGVRPGELYNHKLINKIQRDLLDLDMFKYVNFKFDEKGNKINFLIEANPLKKYQTNTEVGLDYNEHGFPAPFVSFVVKNRNFFRWMDVLNFNVKLDLRNIPLATDVNSIFLSIYAQGGVSLTLPAFIFPFGNKIRQRYNLQNLRTIFYFGAVFSLRPDYERTIINNSISYRWKNYKSSYLLKVNDLSWIITPFLSKEFETRLNDLQNNGNNIRRSFNTSLSSSISFEDVILFNQYGFEQNRSAYLRGFIENGGTFLPLYERYLNTEENGLEVYQYSKLEVDFRQILPLAEGLNFAFRVKAGFVYPYGENGIVPYEKYFFAGGTNGMRAWLPRRLGPGSNATYDENGLYSEFFEQSGEVQLESSFELRKDLIGFIKGSFFIDAGNIWNLTATLDRPNGKFIFPNFFSEIAVGTGIGLRFDFSFLVLRLDVATKVYDPARPEGSKFFLNKNFYKGAFREQALLNYNIGIGYPF